MSRYRKAIVAFGAFLGVAATVLADGLVLSSEYESLGVAALGVLLVFITPNEPAPPA